MSDVFACPECGRKLDVEGDSPGREVQCEECLTWVEVPFLPRNPAWKRARPSTRRSPWLESKILRAAIVFASVALLGLGATRMIGGRVRWDKEQVLAELLASADEAEASKRFDVAFREIEGALAHARTIDSKDSARLVELKGRRDRISLREAGERLDAVDALDPDHAVGESLTIAERARHDPALEPLAGTIEARLDGSRRRQAEADLQVARRAFESGKDAEAFAAAERLHDRAEQLPDSLRKSLQDDARAILEAAVEHSGVTLPPVTGRFVVGSAEAYTATLERHRVEALKARGYLPQPRKSPWAPLWLEKAPFQLNVQIVESREEYYLQSKNRITQVDGNFELIHDGQVAWQTRMVARTRMPLPDLPAYLAGHLATAGKRDPETERLLHDDALAQFVDQAARNLRGLPSLEAAAKMPLRTSGSWPGVGVFGPGTSCLANDACGHATRQQTPRDPIPSSGRGLLALIDIDHPLIADRGELGRSFTARLDREAEGQGIPLNLVDPGISFPFERAGRVPRGREVDRFRGRPRVELYVFRVRLGPERELAFRDDQHGEGLLEDPRMAVGFGGDARTQPPLEPVKIGPGLDGHRRFIGGDQGATVKAMIDNPFMANLV